jgi:low affinity Fe/Cu permease
MNDFFSRLARAAGNGIGNPAAFIAAFLALVVWGLCGPALHYSDTWQLVVNTATSLLTFLMVFLLQNTQNRDARAMQIKLDELLRSMTGARNELVDLENVSEQELQRYCEEFKRLHLRYAEVLEKRGHHGTDEIAEAGTAAKKKTSPAKPEKGEPSAHPDDS